MSKWDCKVEEKDLSESELLERKGTWADLNNLIELKDQLRSHQSRSRWLKEGDTNSSFFQRSVEYKGRAMRIRGIRISGKWKEGVDTVKEGLKNYFEKQFEVQQIVQEGLLTSEMSGSKISVADAMLLEERFSAEEIKSSVWECGMDKSPGPDGFSLLFFRDF